VLVLSKEYYHLLRLIQHDDERFSFHYTTPTKMFQLFKKKMIKRTPNDEPRPITTFSFSLTVIRLPSEIGMSSTLFTIVSFKDNEDVR